MYESPLFTKSFSEAPDILDSKSERNISFSNFTYSNIHQRIYIEINYFTKNKSITKSITTPLPVLSTSRNINKMLTSGRDNRTINIEEGLDRVLNRVEEMFVSLTIMLEGEPPEGHMSHVLQPLKVRAANPTWNVWFY